MALKFLNDEGTLFNIIQNIPPERTLFLTGGEDERKFYDILVQKNIWVNNSGNTNNPPDLYCKKYRIMGDIMQVDDSGHTVHRGRKSVYVNEEKRANSQMYKELMKSGILDDVNVKKILFVGDVYNIPEDEHHQFQWYLNEFKRIVSKHIHNIPIYKRNYQNYKTAFFIYDEASQYIELDTCLYSEKYIENFLSIDNVTMHYPFLDIDFINILKQKVTLKDGTLHGIDYVVWCLQDRCLDTTDTEGCTTSNLIIIDMNNIDNVELIKYFPVRMRIVK